MAGPSASRAAVDGMVWLSMAAVATQLALSSNVLLMFGIPYAAPGGPPFVKFHLSTYCAVAAAILAARRCGPTAGRLARDVAGRPAFPFAIAAMLTCAVYALLSSGITATAVYIESYASAGIFGFALERLAGAQLRRIGRVLLAVLAANALICVAETLTHLHLVPARLVFDTGVDLAPPSLDAFRGTALYDSPLTGALMTMIGVFLCVASDLRPVRKALTLGVLMLALLGFGGRSALAVTTLSLAGLGIVETLRRLASRRVDGRFLAVLLAVAVAVPVLVAGVLLGTHFADRITARAYVDDSALVRILQWSIFDRMDVRDWLFGMARPRLTTLMVEVGLNPPFEDVENFWLLAFFNLGLIGFLIWLAGLAAIVGRLWRVGGAVPRLLLVAVVVVASGNNSLGSKSGVLFIAVAAVMSAAAFAAPPAASRPRTVVRTKMRDAVPPSPTALPASQAPD